MDQSVFLKPRLVVANSLVAELSAEWPDFNVLSETDTAALCPFLVLLDNRLALQLMPAGPMWFPPPFDVRRVSRRSLLARATGVASSQGLAVLDAMAGWGSDGLELASLGARVTMVEAAPTVWSLLRQRVAESAVQVAELNCSDSWSIIERGGWDVILLDPMFPERGRKGLAKYPMQALKKLAHDDGRPLAEWLAHARIHSRSRVVLKRRRTEKVLGRPDWKIEGRSIRFDIYRPNATRDSS